MQTHDKNIPVCFAVYEPYEHFPMHSVQLGCLSKTDLEKFMSAIQDYSPTAKSCIQDLSAQYSANASFGRMPRRYTQHLELTDLFWLKDGTVPPCVKRMCPNVAKRISLNAPEDQRMYICAKNLRRGKCQDEFMRRTLGMMLFPHMYSNDKQK